MKIESYSINFDESKWSFALDSIYKDIKINYTRKEEYSFDSNYKEDNLRVSMEKDKIEHITIRST
ncbi:hypothetical protein HS1_002220 [Candidatus Desulfofervidus auxilii]|uniref:Uncharacterized protein n=1 Tax=Desulfofervidus auxilii TaxID=1621989 RepID=A0A7U4QMG5_DESA2|nr:hypothetical protein [Candidatus Desulfofervidus auxilii]AMM42006.1 hypothetical protein HS1_002220 [Candidatus Desulfofervidus auxilii]CAD7780531.1 hypothetical protein BLFGPEAP_02574 [Candidatus Methanoperedenaceae archaeon GB50]CAD7781802.1 hypothetical protein DMNBHIDG_02755 [Candidatus Methanoperedenaceae archaeon GB37]